MNFVKNLWSIKRSSFWLYFPHSPSTMCVRVWVCVSLISMHSRHYASFTSITLLQFWKLRALFSNQICKSRFICSNYSYTSSACAPVWVCVYIQIAVRFAFLRLLLLPFSLLLVVVVVAVIHNSWLENRCAVRAHTSKVIICNINCLHARRRQTTTTPSTIHLIIHWFEIPLVCITPHLISLISLLLLL